LRFNSQYGGKEKHPKSQKKPPARYPGKRLTPKVCLNFSVLLRLINHQYPPYRVSPPPRVDTKDIAIAESGVATLDRVAVSGRKRGMIYISKLGRRAGGQPADGWGHLHAVSLILHRRDPDRFSTHQIATIGKGNSRKY